MIEKKLRICLKISLLALLGIVLSCKQAVNLLAFFPDQTNTVEDDELPGDIKPVRIITDDGISLHCLLFAYSVSGGIIIYFHGNGGNVYHRLRDYKILESFGYSVLAVEYRGYGKSTGTPSEEGIYLDGTSAVKYAIDTLGYKNDNIVLFGRSIGTTVAINTAKDIPVKGLILVSPLTSAKEQAMASDLASVASLAGDAFNNIGKAKFIKSKTMVIHGTNDMVIPFVMGEKVYSALQCEKQFHRIEGAGHNDLSDRYGSYYWTCINSFLKAL